MDRTENRLDLESTGIRMDMDVNGLDIEWTGFD